MHKRLYLLAFLFLISAASTAQILQPAKLFAEIPSKPVKVGEEIELVFKASIDKNWYLYSVDFADCGPIPMSINFEKNSSYELIGSLVAIKDKTKYDKIFECDVKIFEGTGEFRQKIKVLSPELKLSASYEGQACSDLEGKCVPVDGDLSFGKIAVTGKAIRGEAKEQGAKQEGDKKINESEEEQKTKTETPPLSFGDEQRANTGPIVDNSLLDGDDYTKEESWWGYMVLAFILGITSLITPCVFPMIPMTVTFFLNDNQTKKQGIQKATVFGISIIVIYTVAGTIFALLFGAEGLNALATHWFPNLLVFVLFIVFALSFLGLYEINAPHQLVNRADRAAEKGGLSGIFFMSATLVLVSFSCTIPLVGNVLVLAAGGEVIKPVIGMFAYALAFAVPFTLFAMFPEWMKSLPKSGGWLNSVKVSLGLLELALALKFFSIADQTYHWGLLDREVNIAIWIVIFTVLAFYFLGKIRMPGDTPVEKVSVPRLMLAIATFSFVVYLIPGLIGAPLKALAGYLPPMHTHDFDLMAASHQSDMNEICDQPKYSDFLHLPHGLQGYFDYDQAIACARKQNKPLFIDFTGHGCTNCREMEAVVWSDPQVLERLKNDYVIVALYIDDKTQLPESAWYTSQHDGKVKKTIGKQNADLQIRNLNNNAQPFYCLIGKDERLLVSPYGYDKSVENFVKFLDAGKQKFQELYQ